MACRSTLERRRSSGRRMNHRHRRQETGTRRHRSAEQADRPAAKDNTWRWTALNRRANAGGIAISRKISRFATPCRDRCRRSSRSFSTSRLLGPAVRVAAALRMEVAPAHRTRRRFCERLAEPCAPRTCSRRAGRRMGATARIPTASISIISFRWSESRRRPTSSISTSARSHTRLRSHQE